MKGNHSKEIFLGKSQVDNTHDNIYAGKAVWVSNKQFVVTKKKKKRKKLQ